MLDTTTPAAADTTPAAMADQAGTVAELDGAPVSVVSVLAQLRPLLDADTTHPDPVAGVLQVLVGLVPGVTGATVSRRRKGHSIPRTIAATDPAFDVVDEVLARAGRGPAMEALRSEKRVVTADVAHDPRWPGVERRLASVPPVAVVAVPVRDGHHRVAVLALYSAALLAPAALDQVATVVAILELALVAVGQHERVANLRLATANNRRTGIAVGIVMAHDRSTAEQAFDTLATASQVLNRKVADLAEDVILTGALPDLPTPAHAGAEPHPASA